MDHYRRRERRRLLDGLIYLQREEDKQEQDRAIPKDLERSRDESDDDDDVQNAQNRKKKSCIVKLIYQNRRKNLDEIKVNQNNQIIYKGCLQDGDKFIFKTQRSRNDLRLKLKFYINDVLEDEMIACCEHGLMHRNQRNYFFRIESIIGGKACDNCESSDDSTPKSSSAAPAQSNKVSEENFKEKFSTLSTPEKNLTESFSVDIKKLPEDHSSLKTQSYETADPDRDSLPPVPPQKVHTINNPPPSSTALPQTDSSSTNIPASENTDVLTSSNITDELSQPEQSLPKQSSVNEPSQTEPISSSTILPNSTETPLANDTNQVLSSSLGTLQQPQIDQSENTNILPPQREQGNVEYFILIYLNETNPDETTIKQLRSYVNFLKIFNDTKNCIAFINTVLHEKIILILADSFRKSIIPRIRNLSQVYTVHVLGKSEARNDPRTKIQGFYADINEVYDAISNDINKISRDLIIYLNTSSNAVTLEPVITYFLLLNEIILDKTEAKNDMKDLITFARQEYEGNDKELDIIEEFDRTYDKKDAIYWFSRPCFISKMLNKALRLPEANILFRFRIFIQDLLYQIQEESTKEAITVYLAQTIQRKDLHDLKENITDTDLIIFPQLLYGSTEKTLATQIAKDIPLLNQTYTSLLIQIEIPEGFRCANFDSRRFTRDDINNVLLNMGIMGRIINVEKDRIEADHIASIHIKLIDVSDQQNLQKVLETPRDDIKSFSPFLALFKLMIKTDQYAQAEQFIQTLFNDENLKSDSTLQRAIVAACLILAQNYRNQDIYQHALDLYLTALETSKRFLSPNAVELSSLYSSIGSMYFRLGKYDESYENYDKALNIQKDSNTPDFYSIGSYTNSIGLIYSKQGKYSEAIQSFERTLKALQQTSEPHDAEIAATYEDLGDAYLSQSKFDEALSNYSKALDIEERIQPYNPQNLATKYRTIGNIYMELGRPKESLTHLQRAVESISQIQPIPHETLVSFINNIGLIHLRENEYDHALESFNKTLDIANEFLPENHTLLGMTLSYIGLIYSDQKQYDQAIENIEKSTKQFLKTLPEDHPHIQENNKTIETIKQKQTLEDIFNQTK